MEQKAKVTIQKIETTPNEIQIHFIPYHAFFIPLIPIAIIVAAIALPVTAWIISQPPTPGPLGLPQWFWIGVGVGIPIIGLALIMRRK